MSYTIVWTNEALNTFEDRVTYLIIHFTGREINNFKLMVKEYLAILTKAPHIEKSPAGLRMCIWD